MRATPHIAHHTREGARLARTEALYPLADAYHTRGGKADYGKGSVRMSHYTSFFVTEHHFSPFLELIIFLPRDEKLFMPLTNFY